MSMKTSPPRTWIAASLLSGAALAANGAGATNLLVNGSFDDPKDPLAGWMSDYAWSGNSWYKDNKDRVSVVATESGRKHVLRLSGTRQILWGDGQGVKVDSKPVPFDPDASYKLSLYARTAAKTSNPGPNCRVYIEGYEWKPGIKPHDNPDLSELRKVYKQGSGNILYFGDSNSGPFSNATEKWSMGSCAFPGKSSSEEGGKHLKQIKFICVHIVAIDGWDGDLFVDDVVLEKTGK
jgi:hypothetical protein